MGTAERREWRRLGMFEEALRDWEGADLRESRLSAADPIERLCGNRPFFGREHHEQI